MVRVCYLCADAGVPLDGYKGASAHVRGLVSAFTSLGHEVLVVSPNAKEGTQMGVPSIPVPAPVILDGIPCDQHPRVFRALRHLWTNVAVEQVLGQVLSEYQPALLYERYSPFGIAGGVMAQRWGIPHILEVNAPLAWEGKQYRQQALQDAAEVLEGIAFTTASLIVAVSEELRSELIASGVPASKVVVVPNGVDVNMFTPEAPANHCRLEGEFVIGFVGSLRPWHGIDVLAAAFKRLAVHPEIHLLIVGDGPLADKLNSLQEELPGRITMVGAVPHKEVPKYIRAMDVAVAPYPQLDRFYFSPLKVLEYMAVGRAVIASSIGQVKELIRDGDTGVLVPPGDVDAMVIAIYSLALNEGLRHSLGANAALEVQKAHTWTQRASTIMNLAQAMAEV